MYQPPERIYFLTFCPLILVFLTQICHQTIYSTLLICSTKTTSIFHKKFKFIFFLTISTKQIPLHKLCTFIFLHDFFWNYFKIWCYLLTWFFLLLFTFFFSLKKLMIIYIIFPTQKWDSPGNVPCIHELNCILLSSPQAETEKQSKFVFLVLFIRRKVASDG